MNPEQARSIRFKKRLEDQLDLKDKDRFDSKYFFHPLCQNILFPSPIS